MEHLSSPDRTNHARYGPRPTSGGSERSGEGFAAEWARSERRQPPRRATNATMQHSSARTSRKSLGRSEGPLLRGTRARLDSPHKEHKGSLCPLCPCVNPYSATIAYSENVDPLTSGNSCGQCVAAQFDCERSSCPRATPTADGKDTPENRKASSAAQNVTPGLLRRETGRWSRGTAGSPAGREVRRTGPSYTVYTLRSSGRRTREIGSSRHRSPGGLAEMREPGEIRRCANRARRKNQRRTGRFESVEMRCSDQLTEIRARFGRGDPIRTSGQKFADFVTARGRYG